MNDITLWSSTASHNAAGDTGTQTDLVLAANVAIATAVTSNTFSCTLSLSGKTSGDIQYLLEMLRIKLYGVSVTTTTLTITW